MKKRVLVLHGLGGSDFPHWQSWLSAEVAKDYGCVSFPKLPDFNSPNKDAWMEQLIKELEDFKPDIVICHSLANILWFHVCNQFKLHVVEKLYLVAPPSLKCDMDELKSFYPCEVPKNLYAKASLLITSTNDNYMKKEEAISLQKMLNIPMKIMENAGHINASSGYGEWSWILEEITS
ncbi:MAG: hypothetical protein A2513_00150 [Sulfurimonas sp. RIFOXYD12_FULL_33_39]|uniref:RBBP9/YdeN family alpha/beta hydrolase n=1 Tax=unclassified Sulfurimonas TaxID=2623549 RepID=UPI0008D5AABE|nr:MULTISPECIES: alpha/beta hydrolase [unclassified Sulfurimonas]OHE07691.1 MAG: hypothetical protein A3G74_03045 [Sulfurimonas sp. RIFCSPLOWO2_12_FULL_34_6]OHE10745.1 MAG: hypothetical protein A2513_00150 [Sulfurimonas sp. RIFOXYD12_FULL_33_39]OHE13485.1 MAG: hypothetical protein A2530_08030 [Sulfurimonas sp. RIFOXYD2_FULL_34_21]